MEPVDLNRLAEQAAGKPVDLNDLAGTPPQRAPQPKRSILHPASVPFILAVPAALAIWPPTTATHDSFDLPYAIGSCMGCLIFASLLGLLAGWLASRRVGNLILCLTLSLQTAGIVGVGLRREHAEARKAANARADSVIKAMSDKAPEDVTAGDRKAVVDSLANASQHARGDQAHVLAASADTIRRIAPSTNEMQERLKAFTDLGGTDVTTCRSSADIDARLAAARILKESAERLAAELRGAGAVFQQHLIDRGMPEPRAKAHARAWTSGGNFESAARVRELDVEILDHCTAMLTTLRDHWGQWRFEPGRDRPVFANPDPAVIGAYNQHAADLADASDRQRQLIAATEAKSAPAKP